MHISVEVAGNAAIVTLDAPERLGAVTGPDLNEIADHVERLEADPAVRVIALTGTGRAFCAGAALSGAFTDTTTLEGVDRLVRVLHACRTPTLALVGGVAAGAGVSIALVCDYVIASEEASFMLAFTRIGLMPDGGATALVAASIGRARAQRLALLAERLSARVAADWGLIAECVPAEEYADRCRALLTQLAAGPPLAYAATAEAIDAATLDLDAALRREDVGQRSLSATADCAEGIEAFLGKRPARFVGA